jgi:hypothetical protein
MRNAGVKNMKVLSRCCFVNRMRAGVEEIKPRIVVKQFPEMFN